MRYYVTTWYGGACPYWKKLPCFDVSDPTGPHGRSQRVGTPVIVEIVVSPPRCCAPTRKSFCRRWASQSSTHRSRAAAISGLGVEPVCFVLGLRSAMSLSRLRRLCGRNFDDVGLVKKTFVSGAETPLGLVEGVSELGITRDVCASAPFRARGFAAPDWRRSSPCLPGRRCCARASWGTRTGPGSA